MATLDQIEKALIRADQAGDADAARLLAAEVRRMRSEAKTSPVTGGRQIAQQPQEKDVGLGERIGNVWSGIKNAVAAPVVGAAQMLGVENAQNIADAWREHAEELGKRPGGSGGQVVGALIPASLASVVPGANTIGGGAVVGGLLGGVQPTAEGESRLANTVFGAASGAGIPASIRAAKTIRAMAIDPFTDAGRTRIAGRVINNAAGNNAASVAQTLENATGNTPGFVPSVGQAARNDGVAALERAIRANNPQAFNDLNRSQTGALADALLSVAKTPEERAIAVANREAAVKPFYEASKAAVVQGDPVLDWLLQRPSMKTAAQRAANLANERGESFALPQTQPADYSGRTLHDIKLGLDDAIGSPAMGMQGAERAAAIGTRNDFLNWLEAKIPEYEQARVTHADMSRPINQIDIGQALYNRLVPALADQGNLPFRTNAQQYANALRNGDAFARQATGFKGATMRGAMTPDQMDLLEGIARDAESKAAAETAGRGAGSDTVQKLSMTNLAQQAGIPTFFANVASVPGGWVKRAGDILYKSADDQIRENLAFLLTNPQEASKAMNAAGAAPWKYAEPLKTIGQGLALTALPAYNAVLPGE